MTKKITKKANYGGLIYLAINIILIIYAIIKYK